MGNLTPFLLIRDSAQFGARRLTGDHGGWGNPTPLCDRAEAVEDPAHHRHRHAVADGAVAGGPSAAGLPRWSIRVQSSVTKRPSVVSMLHLIAGGHGALGSRRHARGRRCCFKIKFAAAQTARNSTTAAANWA